MCAPRLASVSFYSFLSSLLWPPVNYIYANTHDVHTYGAAHNDSIVNCMHACSHCTSSYAPFHLMHIPLITPQSRRPPPVLASSLTRTHFTRALASPTIVTRPSACVRTADELAHTQTPRARAHATSVPLALFVRHPTQHKPVLARHWPLQSLCGS